MSRISKSGGVISIEFALILSVALAPLFWIAIEAGRVYYQYDVVIKNIRIAGRYLSAYSQSETKNSNYEVVAKNMVKCGTLTANGCNKAVVTGLTNSTISISYSNNENVTYTGASAAVSYVTIQVTGFKLNYLSEVFNLAPITFNNPIGMTFRQALI